MRFDIATLHDLMSAATLMDDGDRLAFYALENGTKDPTPEIVLVYFEGTGFRIRPNVESEEGPRI